MEVQVQEAVNAIDNTINTARTQRDIALQQAQNEKRMRIEAEEELKRAQDKQKQLQEEKTRKSVDRVQAMVSATKATELDSLFEELDKAIGVDLDFDLGTDENLDQEENLEGRQIVCWKHQQYIPRTGRYISVVWRRLCKY